MKKQRPRLKKWKVKKISIQKGLSINNDSEQAITSVKLKKSDLWGAVIVTTSRPEVPCKKGVLKSFTKFTVKYFCQNSFSIKLQA